MAFAKTCTCGRRVAPGQKCPCGRGSEADRLRRQPQRAGYRSREYRLACKVADKRADGKCEACGLPLPQRPDGRYICEHHHIDGNPANNPTDGSNILVCGTCCHRGARRPGCG